MDGHFLEAFASPFGPGFWCRLGGGRAPLYSFWGVPGVRSGPSSGSLGLPWPLSALFGRPLGRDARLRVVPPVVYGNLPNCGF